MRVSPSRIHHVDEELAAHRAGLCPRQSHADPGRYWAHGTVVTEHQAAYPTEEDS